jgi:DNA adenine methylase
MGKTLAQMVRSDRVRPVLTWPGGKTKHLDRLLPLIRPHLRYVEVFFGGGALLLAKPKSSIEVINDANSELVNFYRVVKYHMDGLIQELQYVLNSRQDFRDYTEQPGLTDIQRAARFLMRNKLSFGGNMKSFGASCARGSRHGLIDRIEAVCERLYGVVIENLDWQRCVETYDREDTFFFLDPPYLNNAIGAYKAWTVEHMAKMAEVLGAIKGDWILTVDDSADCRRLFKAFHKRHVEKTRGVADQRVTGVRKMRELIITPRERANPEEESFSA